MDVFDQQLAALERQRLTLLKTKRLVLRAQRVAARVSERVPTRRLERVVRALRSVQKSQDSNASTMADLPLFFTTRPRKPRHRKTSKPVRQQDELGVVQQTAIGALTSVPEEYVQPFLLAIPPKHTDYLSDTDNGVSLVPKGRWSGSPPPTHRYNLRESTKNPTPSQRPASPAPPAPPTTLPIRKAPRSRSPKKRPTTPVESPPTPTQHYLTRSLLPPQLSPIPQPLLLVLDLNGTLIHRRVGTSTGHPRPHLPSFLSYALTHHRILIWSSAKPSNIRPICKKLFPSPTDYEKLVDIWGRDTLGLTKAQYTEKVQVYKDLEKVWRDEKVQASHPEFLQGGRWHQGNTLLLDDSREKARAQPYNLVEVPEWTSTSGQEEGQEILAQVTGWIEDATRYTDVSAVGRTKPFKVNDGWGWDWEKGAAAAAAAGPVRAGTQEIEGKVGGSSFTKDGDETEEEDGGVALGMDRLRVVT